VYDAETHKQAIIDASQMRPSMLNEEDEEATSNHHMAYDYTTFHFALSSISVYGPMRCYA
jgi:hypothetical protein